MIRFARHPLSLTLASVLALSAAPAFAQHAETFDETVFFGDSLSDAGYFRPLLPAAAQPVTGQFTTNPGLVWSQYLADYYGTHASTAWLATGATPRADSGSNYAVGGARVGTDVTGALGYTPSLTSQVNEYLRRSGGRANPNALYTVWGGANDLFAVTAGAPAQATIGAAVGAQVGIVGRLQSAGAQYVLVPTIPDLGMTPGFLAQGAAASAQGTALASGYNSALFGALAAQNLRVIPLNTFTFLREVAANPGAYNFRNVTGTACQPQITAQSLTCNPTSYVTPDAPSAYAFADGVHPTTAAHKILADYAVATIEGPRQIAVLPHSAAAIGWQRAGTLADQFDTRHADAAGGGRFWGDLRYDNQRYQRGMAGDGFDGDGLSLSAGYDNRSGALLYGVFGNLGRQRLDYGARRGDFRQKEAGIGGHIGWHGASAWVDGQLGWTRLDYDIHRDVWLGPAMRTHSGSANGDNISAGASGGWRFGHGRLSHGPVARVLAQRIRIDGYTESQPELSTALAYPSQDFDSLQGSLGWQADFSIRDNLQVFARVTADHEFGDAPAQAYAQVTSLPATMPFAVPAPMFDDSYGTLAYGVRSQLWGMDMLTGSTMTIGQKGGSNLSTYLTVAKRF